MTGPHEHTSHETQTQPRQQVKLGPILLHLLDSKLDHRFTFGRPLIAQTRPLSGARRAFYFRIIGQVCIRRIHHQTANVWHHVPGTCGRRGGSD
jgi:hypothetical protein